MGSAVTERELNNAVTWWNDKSVKDHLRQTVILESKVFNNSAEFIASLIGKGFYLPISVN